MSPKEIKLMRLEHLNVTQESLADAIGVSRLVLSHYETGFRRPGPTVKILFYIVNYQKIFFREAIDSLKPLKTIDLKGKNNTIPVDKSNI